MASALECGICLEPFGEQDNKPMMMPCGHSFCYKCMVQLAAKALCPQCKQQVPGLNASKLPINYTLLSVVLELKTEKLDVSRRYWCSTCKVEATPPCGDAGHSLQGLRGLRRALTRKELRALTRYEKALMKESDAQGVVLEQMLTGSERSRALRERVHRCADRLWDCGEPWQQLQEEAELLLQEESGLEEDFKLLRCEESFSVCSATWQAEQLQLQDHPQLSLALLQLRRTGQLQQRRRPEVEVSSWYSGSAAGLPPPAQNVVAMDLGDLSHSNPMERMEDKAALLAEDAKVFVVRGLLCNQDEAWATALLLRHARTLQELELHLVGMEQLRKLQSMPGLVSLRLVGCQRDLQCSSAGGAQQWKGRLQRLQLEVVPYGTALATLTLSAHRDSLQEVRLVKATRAQLRELQRMPALRQLDLRQCRDKRLGTLSEEPWRGRLQWLRLSILPFGLASLLLRAHAASLQELHLCCVSARLLALLGELPALRRLELSFLEGELPPASVREEEEEENRLQWLKVQGLPGEVLLPLLRKHRASLQHLELGVSSDPEEEDEVPAPMELKKCGMKALTSLSLLRQGCHATDCRAQLAALRAALAGCNVSCSACRNN